jgi:hypothetical protein
MEFLLKKIILAVAVAALAVMAVASSASADVARCDALLPVNTTVTTATFTMTQPANEYRQWENVWTHDFTVTVNADHTFSGTGIQTGHDANGDYTGNWSISGTFGQNNTVVGFVATRADGLVIKLDNETMGDDVATTATSVTFGGSPVVLPEGEKIEEKVSTPKFVTDTTTAPGTESAKNHGQYVKALGGGKDAAQACAGMPLNSKQGQK